MNSDIAVKVLFFGAARDAVGHGEVDVRLNGSQTAESAFAAVLERFPALRRFGSSLLFAVNQEYAQADSTLEVHNGDELAVFPPVSGGSPAEKQEQEETNDADTGIANTGTAGGAGSPADVFPSAGVLGSPASTLNATKTDRNDFFELTTDPINVGAVARRVVRPECGATVTLDGYAREWTKARRTLYLAYEAYAPMALSELERLGREAHEQFEISYIGIVHRTGRLEIGETSVVIAVGAPHRRAAFAACEWAIRALKRTVPIWKKEIFEDGEVWVEGEDARGFVSDD
jgi:molybdopterin synthase catalytic subunit